MNLAFWEWMIRGIDNVDTTTAGKGPLGEVGLIVRNGILKSACGPYRARDFFNIQLVREDGPIWTFDRMGATRTHLPDGRIICVAGEHEDFYDPDFYIYNDVVVLDPSGQIEIYGYPKAVFPPTDFHTATVALGGLLIIGGVGYPKERSLGHTPVYLIDLTSYRIEVVETFGEMPGWISGHDANYESEGSIRISGGKILQSHEGKQRFRANEENYALDLRSRVWRRLSPDMIHGQ